MADVCPDHRTTPGWFDQQGLVVRPELWPLTLAERVEVVETRQFGTRQLAFTTGTCKVNP